MKTAMILAAGRGKRLRPLTWDKPKCLTQLNEAPLLEYHLQQLATNGFKKIVINHAYLGGLIRQYVAKYQNNGIEILFSPEPVGGLETGGGIRQALPLLGDSPFVAINADIVTNFDYSRLPCLEYEKAHVVLTPKNHHFKKGDFGLSKSGLALNSPKRYTFAGIACYHPKVFNKHPLGRYSVAPLLRKLADNGHLSAQLFNGEWFDVGSLHRLKEAQDFLSNNHYQDLLSAHPHLDHARFNHQK